MNPKMILRVIRPGICTILWIAAFTWRVDAQSYTIHTVADAFVRGGIYADINYGEEPELIVKQGNVEEYFRKAYLKFDPSGVDGTLVDSAILRIYVHDFSGFMRVDLFQCSPLWEELTINWSNAPPMENYLGGFPVYDAGRWYEHDITSLFLQQLSREEIFSVVLYDTIAYNQQVKINSREATENKPSLEIITGTGIPPESPAELEAYAQDVNSIVLDWQDHSHNEVGFVIEQKMEGDSFQPVDTVAYNVTRYVASGLDQGTTYSYRIYAAGFAMDSPFSNEDSATTVSLPSGPPEAPGGLKARSVSTGQVDLSWNDLSSEEVCFVIERSVGDDNFLVLDSVEADVTEYHDYGLAPSTGYRYRVYSSNLYFDSEPAQEVEVQTGSTGITYYLNIDTGDDTYPGTSIDSAWRSLDRANTHYFSPGDSLLLSRNSTWTGKLWPKGTGTEDLPIRIGAYGEGNLPVIDGNGLEGTGVLYLYNQSYWEISNLEITNDATSEGMRRGVEIAGEEFGTIRHIYLQNLHVHHIRGSVGDDFEIAKKTGGIFFMVWENNVLPTRFDDIKIEDCLIHNCSNQGIVTFNQVIGYPGTESWMSRRITGMVIRNNTIHHISKNAMILRMMEGGLVEHNLCYTTATGTTGNTIFTRSSRNVICQYNEGYDNRSPDYDGSLYDADLESPGCVFQYSYSHDNAHGLYWQCTVQQDSGIIVRYNISQNDRGRIFYINYPSNGTHIYNNTVFVNEGLSPVILMESGSQGGTRTYTFQNNLIVNMSPSASYRSADSKYIKSRIIENNLFYGIHPPTEPLDPFKVTGDPKLAEPGNAGTGLESTFGYRLTEGSAAIDRGMAIPGNGGSDYWGNPLYIRIPDIGAHEYEGPTGASENHRINDEPVLKIHPNPMQDRVSIELHVPEEVDIVFEILDSLGRTVHLLEEERHPAGAVCYHWDGSGPDSRLVENGLYICNVRVKGSTNEQFYSRSIVIQR